MSEEELEKELQKEYDRVIKETYKRLAKDIPVTRAKLHKALLEANKLYWVARLKKIDEFFTASVEETAAVLSVPYIAAAQTFSQQVKSIYATYKSAFDLPASKADELLKNVRYDRTIMQNLQAIANDMPDGKEKTEILAEIAAPAYRYRIQRADLMAQQVAETCKNIARGEIPAERAALQTTVEQAYNITLEGMTGKTPAETMIEEIEKRVQPAKQTVAPTAFKEIQEFSVTKDRGILGSFHEINDRAVSKIVNHNWHGDNFSGRIWEHTDQVAEEVKKVLLEGELTGASVNKMSAEIMRRFSVGAYQARRLIRTENNYIQNQAALESYRESGIERYRYLAIIDGRQSDICEDLNGKIFFLKDATVGVNYPPMHPNCRSTVVPVTKTDDEVKAEIDSMIDSIPAPEGEDPLVWLGQQLEELAKTGYRVA